MDSVKYLDLLLLFLIVTSLEVSVSGTSSDHIIQIFPKCPKSEAEPVVLLVKADIRVLAQAVCSDGRRQNFTQIDDVTYKLRTTLTNHTHSTCTFNKERWTRSYWLSVDVYINGMILADESAMVVCVLDRLGRAKSDTLQLTDTDAKVTDLRTLHGKTVSGVVSTLRLVTVDGDIVSDSDVTIGEKVRLVATMEENTTYTGVSAFDCHATAQYTKNGTFEKEQMKFLQSGCGLGEVIPRHLGFYTNGSLAFSPYFDAFRFPTSNTVRYVCSFVVCRHNCDGDSCENQRGRSKRDIPKSDDNMTYVPQGGSALLAESQVYSIRRSHRIPSRTVVERLDD